MVTACRIPDMAEIGGWPDGVLLSQSGRFHQLAEESVVLVDVLLVLGSAQECRLGAELGDGLVELGLLDDRGDLAPQSLEDFPWRALRCRDPAHGLRAPDLVAGLG